MTTIQANIANTGLPGSAAQGTHDRPPVNGTPARSDTPTKDAHDRPVDVVELSPQAIEAAATEADPPSAGNEQPAHQDTADANTTDQDQKQDQDPSEPKSTTGQKLTKEDQEQVRKLKERDQEVRRHEAAHKAAAGQFASGGPTFDFQRGPDGKQYAVGGEVQIDTSPVDGDPTATIRKMETIRRAALAPAEPSSQDRSVAADASQKAQKARQELHQQNTEKTAPSSETKDTATDQASQTHEQETTADEATRSTDTSSDDRRTKPQRDPHAQAQEAFSKANALAGQVLDTLA